MRLVSPHPFSDDIAIGQRQQALGFLIVRKFLLDFLVPLLKDTGGECLPRTVCVCVGEINIVTTSRSYTVMMHMVCNCIKLCKSAGCGRTANVAAHIGEPDPVEDLGQECVHPIHMSDLDGLYTGDR